MLKRRTLRFLSERDLPRRYEQPSFVSSTLALPNHVWFTPEAIIFDAISVYVAVPWLWQVFKRAVPIFVFRILALVLLSLLVVSPKVQAESSTTDAVKSIPIQNKQVIQIATKITADQAPVTRWPVPFSYLSSRFSAYHKGIDIPSKYGQLVYPFKLGKVIFAGWDGGFGKIVVILHEDGFVSKYAHLSAIRVRKNQEVSTKTVVGNVGVTGYATGAHLHFEIHTKDGAADPLYFLP
ncbi:MAG: hypothetical protein A2Z11_03835 [Candidatus Woykebacteria bacterium RBG_16_43_9]|uniref:M23ase beta-sheet core domain-containing protein n=1 Tax=Candidatus Woykebacteria bacterium RBG_16_43_9 TaxID=1802596 RepID=A0A1G1WCU6_9BACT|nr:MAG: hypothetical protein A2Z11_03835 [Candidatus Woykebacteria bacterium RBG_16_43_9]